VYETLQENCISGNGVSPLVQGGEGFTGRAVPHFTSLAHTFLSGESQFSLAWGTQRIRPIRVSIFGIHFLDVAKVCSCSLYDCPIVPKEHYLHSPG